KDDRYLMSTTIHVSPAGSDRNDGTAGAPIRTFARLEAILDECPGITDVVLHPGVYRETLSLRPPQGDNAAEYPPLVVRAAERHTAILDGGARITAATPLRAGGPVYRVKRATRPDAPADPHVREIPALWDAAGRIRYLLVADLKAVEHFPASYCI